MWHDFKEHALPYSGVPCACLLENEHIPIIATYYQSGDLVGASGEDLPKGWYYFLVGTSDRRYVQIAAQVVYWMYLEDDPRNGTDQQPELQINQKRSISESKKSVRRQWDYK
jgi:hypothetical protein